MSVLTKGRTELSCYDVIGGIKRVFLFKYEDYAYNQIVGTKGVELTSFPATTIYQFEIATGNFVESIQQTPMGQSYAQSLSFTFTKRDLATTSLIDTLNNIELRYIVEFNDGVYRIGGLYNGARLSAASANTGGRKGDFNGYNLTITSTELYSAAVIENLEDVGFTIYGVEYSMQWQD